MNRKASILNTIVGALFFTLLFYKQATGLNLVIFELTYVAALIAMRQLDLRNKNMVITVSGLLITAVFTVITHSVYGYVIHYLTFAVFVGMLIYPQAMSLITATGLSFMNIGGSQLQFFSELAGLRFKGINIGSLLRKVLIYTIPVIIIIVFIILYRNSNPWFNNLAVSISKHIGRWFDYIFKDFDFRIIVTFLIGIMLCNYLLMWRKHKRIVDYDRSSTDDLLRLRKDGRGRFKVNSLKNEFRAGIFLLVVLNFIILILDILDIWWVWFHFTWNGQYLKQFVHEGTYMLIFSILISIIVALFFFRKNLNFYPGNHLLKILSYIWLAQNAILAVSVGVRNGWYIYYYNLAYKRIGVIIFLVLTVYGLFSVFQKVRKRKTPFYLFRTNAMSLYIVLVVGSLINWDTLIAKYNFSRAERSFLHLDFMAALSDKALPYLDVSLADLNRIDTLQKHNFPNEKIRYMNPGTYHSIIESRKKFFVEKWKQKSFLSWNLAEQLAFNKISGEKQPAH